MDCRWTLCLAAALLGAAAGCDAKTLPLWPSSTPPPGATTPTPPPLPPINSPEAKDDFNNPSISPERVTELKPATLVAGAAFKETEAEEVAKTSAQAEAFREEARQCYQRALEVDPKYAPAHLGLARFFERQNNHERAMVSYQEALRLSPTTPGLWFEIGMIHARHREWDVAVEHLRKASELDPDNRTCTKTLGLCLARAGRYEESLVCLERVEGVAGAHLTVARMLHHMKQDDASREQVKRAIEAADPQREAAQLNAAQQLLDELEGRAAAPVAAEGGNETK